MNSLLFLFKMIPFYVGFFLVPHIILFLALSIVWLLKLPFIESFIQQSHLNGCCGIYRCLDCKRKRLIRKKQPAKFSASSVAAASDSSSNLSKPLLVKDVNGNNLNEQNAHEVIEQFYVLHKNSMDTIRDNVESVLRPFYTIFFLFVPVIVIFVINPTSLTSHVFKNSLLDHIDDGSSYNNDHVDITHLQNITIRLLLSVFVIISYYTSYDYLIAKAVYIFANLEQLTFSRFCVVFFTFSTSDISSFCHSTNAQQQDDQNENNSQQNQSHNQSEASNNMNAASLLKTTDDASKVKKKNGSKENVNSLNKINKGSAMSQTHGVWIALSGGGIRAASVAVGALEKFHELEISDKNGFNDKDAANNFKIKHLVQQDSSVGDYDIAATATATAAMEENFESNEDFKQNEEKLERTIELLRWKREYANAILDDVNIGDYFYEIATKAYLKHESLLVNETIPIATLNFFVLKRITLVYLKCPGYETYSDNKSNIEEDKRQFLMLFKKCFLKDDPFDADAKVNNFDDEIGPLLFIASNKFFEESTKNTLEENYYDEIDKEGMETSEPWKIMERDMFFVAKKLEEDILLSGKPRINSIASDPGALDQKSIGGHTDENYNIDQKIEDALFFAKEKTNFKVKAISAVSGGGYAGSSYLLWKKRNDDEKKVIEENSVTATKEDEDWFQHYKEHMRKHIGFLVHWKDGSIHKPHLFSASSNQTIQASAEPSDVERVLQSNKQRSYGTISQNHNNPLNNLTQIPEQEEERCVLFKMLMMHAWKVWSSTLDSIWAVIFLFIAPFAFSVAAFAPILIVVTDIYEEIIVRIGLTDASSPFIKVYCLPETFENVKDPSMSWDHWVSDVERCKFGTVLTDSTSCKLIQFHDPFPSVFLFSIIGCLFVYMLSIIHCLRFGMPCKSAFPVKVSCDSSNCPECKIDAKDCTKHPEPCKYCNDCDIHYKPRPFCIDWKEYSKKGSVVHTTLVFFISILGYCVASLVHNYKCTDAELLIRIFLFTMALLNVIIPLLSFERYGGVLFFFTTPSLIISVYLRVPIHDTETVGKEDRLPFQLYSNWNLALIVSGFLLILSPELNHMRFNIFSNYYRHRISYSYYPKPIEQVLIREDDGTKGIGSIWKMVIQSIDMMFALIRFPYALENGLFFINDRQLDQITDVRGTEFISQISVHNVSDNYDSPPGFMSDSTISKDILIASSKFGYKALRRGKAVVPIEMNKIGRIKYKQKVLTERVSNAVHVADTLIDKRKDILQMMHDHENLPNPDPTKRTKNLNKLDRKILTLIQQIQEDLANLKMKKKKIEELESRHNDMHLDAPLVATVTAVSGGAFSPSVGDQMPDSPTTMIAIFGGFCARWISTNHSRRRRFRIDLFFSFSFMVISCILIGLGIQLVEDCHDTLDACDNEESRDTRDYLFAVEIALFVIHIGTMILLICMPDHTQKTGIASHPFIISLLSMLSVPFNWDGITSFFASDGGHYENLGIIPLLIHKDLSEGDVLFSVDASQENSIKSQVTDVDIDISDLEHPNPLDKQYYEPGDRVMFSSNHPLYKNKMATFVDYGERTKMSGGKRIGCFKQKDMSKCTVRVGHIEEYVDFPSTLFLGLNLVKDYDSQRFDFTYKVDIAELRDYLGVECFMKLTAKEFMLLSCDPHNLKETSDTEKECLMRKRFLKINVTRIDKIKNSQINVVMYHIRPRAAPLGSTKNYNLLGPDVIKWDEIRYCCDGEGRCLKRCKHWFDFTTFTLRVQQFISILLFSMIVTALPTVPAYFMGLYVMHELYESDDGASLPSLISAGFGIMFVIGAFAMGNRMTGIPLLFISLLPILLSYNDESSDSVVLRFWLLVCILIVFALVTLATCAPISLFGVFPNHNTVTMQPFGNCYIFSSYADEGYSGVTEAWEDLSKSASETNKTSSIPKPKSEKITADENNSEEKVKER